jgi:hypothetical protein
MLTGGVGAGAFTFVDLGEHRRAATMMLAMWSEKAVPQNNAAATAEDVMGAMP